jgi:hypothetical protein
MRKFIAAAVVSKSIMDMLFTICRFYSQFGLQVEAKRNEPLPLPGTEMRIARTPTVHS